MKINLPNYYDRTDLESHKDYKKLLFLAGRRLQSSEMNEISSIMHQDINDLTNTILIQGDFLNGGSVIADDEKRVLICGKSKVFLSSYFVNVDEREIPFDRSVEINDDLGIVIKTEIITEVEDNSLKDQAVNTRAFMEPGAQRLKITGYWKLRSELDPDEEEFFTVTYNIIKGNIVKGNQLYPWERGTQELVAKYDRNSNGNYIIEGFNLTYLPTHDITDGNKWDINISDGNANVYGYNHEKNWSTILTLDPLVDNATQQSEPYSVVGSSTGAWYQVRHTPIKYVARISGDVLVENEEISHGNKGSKEKLRNNPVVRVIKISKLSNGDESPGNLYSAGSDYSLAGDEIQWLSGAMEPDPGETYYVTYLYRKTTEANPGLSTNNHDTNGGIKNGTLRNNNTEVWIGGFYEGTIFSLDYEYILPRVDKIYLNMDGEIDYLKGTPKEFNPEAPKIDLNGTMLELGTVFLNAFSEPMITQSSLKVYKQSDIANIEHGVRALEYNVGKLILKDNIRSNQPLSTFKNMVVDDFTNDNMRDNGYTPKQTALCIGGTLINGINWKTVTINSSSNISQVIPYSSEASVLHQDYFTTKRLVNEFTYVNPPVANIYVIPNKFTWVETETYQEFFRQQQHADVNKVSTSVVNAAPIVRTSETGRGFSRRLAFSLTSTSVSTKSTSETNRESLGTTNRATSSISNYDKLVEIPSDTKIRVFSDDKTFDSGEMVDVKIDDTLIETVKADGTGKIDKEMTIPKGVFSGFRRIQAVGQINKRTGSSVFHAQPLQKNITNTITEHWRWSTTTHVTKTVQKTTTRVWRNTDPIAETFKLDKICAVSSIDLFFDTFPVTPTTVVVCETLAGVPNIDKVLLEKTIEPNKLANNSHDLASDGSIGPNTFTRFTFPTPRILAKDAEYAIVVICDDNVGKIKVAKLGERDDVKGKWLYSQVYVAGTLMHSSNIKAWTPIQDEDMRFRINSAVFPTTEHKVELGTINCGTDAPGGTATDIMFMVNHELQEGTSVDYYMRMATGGSTKDILITPFVQTSLDVKYTGELSFYAIMKTKNPLLTPYIDTSVQVGLGNVEEVSEYVTRAFEVGKLAPSMSSIIFDIYLDTYTPTGTKIEVYYDDGTTPGDGSNWWLLSDKSTSNKQSGVTLTGESKAIGGGFYEHHYTATGVTITPEAVSNIEYSRIKIKLINTLPQYRPSVENMRFSVQFK